MIASQWDDLLKRIRKKEEGLKAPARILQFTLKRTSTLLHSAVFKNIANDQNLAAQLHRLVSELLRHPNHAEIFQPLLPPLYSGLERLCDSLNTLSIKEDAP